MGGVMPGYVPQDEMTARYRSNALDLATSKILITNFDGTQQESDLSEPANCGGFGRVRHFIRKRFSDWPSNPLPIDPAVDALHLSHTDQIRTQVFQFAACSWRCWYCFVPYSLLDANRKHAAFLSAAELIDLWMAEENRPPMVDLTGGAPELVPEWILWMMQELQKRGLHEETYLWSDDSLSNDLFWTSLSDSERDFLAGYRNYGRVCCLKGFDNHSFSFNTHAHPDQFALQFERLKRLLQVGLDVYVYVTFTTDDVTNLAVKVSRFVDQLQSIDENLPLRVVPLRVDAFTPTATRLNHSRIIAMRLQKEVVCEWCSTLDRRFPSTLRELSINRVPLRRGRRA
jgi:uncharacterized Fe-S cluster-containing radical SAM superfamily protein